VFIFSPGYYASTILNPVPRLGGTTIGDSGRIEFGPEDFEEPTDLIIYKNENKSVKSGAAKEQSVSSIQNEEAPGRAASEQIAAQPEMTLTYCMTTCQLQAECI